MTQNRKRCAWAQNPLAIAYHDIRNRAKIEAAVSNARGFIGLQREFGSFDRYLWAFVGGTPLQGDPCLSHPPASSELSDALSKDLRKRGFKFVGSTIMYAYMQAVGMLNDHSPGCFRRPALAGRKGRAAVCAQSASKASAMRLRKPGSGSGA